MIIDLFPLIYSAVVVKSNFERLEEWAVEWWTLSGVYDALERTSGQRVLAA